MNKFNLIVIVFLLFQLIVQAQFNICPQVSYTMGVTFAYAVNDQIYWAGRRDVPGTIVTTDGGNTWTSSSFTDPSNTPVYCIHAFNADTAFVVASTIYKTTDRGNTWIPASGVFKNSASFPNTIHFFDQNNGVAMGDPVDGYFEIYTTSNAGVNWVRVLSSNIPASLTGEAGVINLHAFYNNSYWFSTSGTRIFRSTDRGYTWTCSQLPTTTGWIPSIAFRDELHGIADCYTGTNWYYYNTSDGGSTWTQVALWPSWIYGYMDIEYIPGTQSTYTINAINYSGKELKNMMLFTKDDGLTWHRMDDWGTWLAGDGFPWHQWASVNSGWGSSYRGNEGCIYHWPGYTGKHIWRAGSSLRFGCQAIDEIGDTLGISIGNYGTLPTTINSLTLSSTEFSIVNPPALPIVLQPWDAIDLDIAITPETHGLINDSLVVFSDAENYSSISVALSGKGLEFTPPVTGLIYAASDSLYNFNLSNLTATSVGCFDGPQIEGLTIRPTDSVLIGVSTRGLSSTLYRIDPIIGGCVPIVTIPVGNIRAIAYNNTGTLFAGSNAGELYNINTNTGQATLIGTTSGKKYSAFAINPQDGKLYASVLLTFGSPKDAIYLIDTLTGAAALLGLTGDGKPTISIAFNDDGTLYGLKGRLAETNKLITISTTDGAGTEIGTLGKTGLQAIIMRNVVTDVKEKNEGAELTSYELFQNYPNPFNPTTTIGYVLKERTTAKLILLNAIGEVIAVLVNEEQEKGFHKVDFNASTLASGVYFYRLQAGDPSTSSGQVFVQTRKMILIK